MIQRFSRTKCGSVIFTVPGVFVLLGAACTGDIEPLDGRAAPGGPTSPNEPPDVVIPPGDVQPARTGIRRLTKNEYRQTLMDLVGVDPTPHMYGWPSDGAPFDTDYPSQLADGVLIDAAKTVASAVAVVVASDPTLRAQALGCAEQTPACLRQFITTFGRRALRRPLDSEEVATLEAMATRNGATFFVSVELVIRALLQDPEFLYLVECGGCTVRGPVTGAGPVRLGQWEMASRLSYLVFGSTPSNELLDLAAQNGLADPIAVGSVAARMLTGSFGGKNGRAQARERMSRFHAMWLGYEEAPLALAQPMRTETKALLDRVIFDKSGSWLDVFRAEDSFVDAALAAHYGLPKPASTGGRWIPYGGTGRRGILSHATFLSVANAPGDTSTTLRGKHVRNKLLCEEIPPPDLALLKKLNNGKDVDVDRPPEPEAGECRVATLDRTYLGNPGCAACHSQMDPIGLGLENYDKDGKYRTTELGRPNCRITGDGKLQTTEAGETVTKPFKGPAGLADLLTGTPEASRRLGACASKNFYQFAIGRDVGADEQTSVEALAGAFEESGFNFKKLVLRWASSPAFLYRAVDSTMDAR
jgi:hypothetical protein